MRTLTLIVVLITGAAWAQSKALTKVPIGMEGRILYRCPGTMLRAKPVNDKARVTARIISAVPDGDATLYDIRFISQYAGRPDVRDALDRIDGSTLSDAPAAIVDVSMALPLDHDGSLEISDGLGVPRLGGYRAAIIGLGIVWLIPFGMAIAARLRRRKPRAVAGPFAAPLTLADQLRPLVQAVIEGRATLADKALLERMLIAFWRERLQLGSVTPIAALARLREDQNAGTLLRAVEGWLHRPRRAETTPPDVTELLRPYAAAPVSAAKGAAAA